MTIEGEEAEKWAKHCDSVCTVASVHHVNPFDNDLIKWNIQPKGTAS